MKPTPKTYTKPQSQSLVHHFKHAGRRYTLRKRTDGRDSPWYFTGQIRGRRLHRSMDTNVAAVAAARAVQSIIEPARLENWKSVDRSRLKAASATVGQLVEVWRVAPLKVSRGHRRQVENNLLAVLRRAGCADPLNERAEILNPQTVRKYFGAVLAATSDLPQGDAARAMRSANSVFNSGRSLVRPAVLAHYEDAGLVLPDMAGWHEEFKRRRFESVAVEPEPVSFSVMRGLLRSWVRMGNWNEFAAVAMELAFGLRAGEVSQVRWEHFRRVDGTWELAADAAVKRGGGRLVVRALDPFWRVFWRRARREGRTAGGHVLEGSMTARGDSVFRSVSAWMRSSGWERQKTNHAFRGFAGALVASRWSLQAAALWLRHRSVTTTERHYTRDYMERLTRTRAGFRVEWAR